MIEFILKDRDDPTYKKNSTEIPTRRVRRRGTTFDINGELIELFTIGTLAEAMDRDFKCILRWEKLGLFPQPVFQVTGHGKTKRWYSAMQVVNCHRIAWYKYRFAKGRYFDPKAFCKDVREVFGITDRLAVTTRGVTIKR